ncbi:MAG TPA: twin-arginine translocase TatA/TatE family subunit [Solirubrobacteraceae bacterium]|nr:twin-arginine translocase TatA/TatE family subunit [Solirubrobacteraceae bacterium]
MPSIGPMELVVVLIIALVVLGPKKLPEVGRSVGKGMREFKASLTGETEPRADDAIEKPVLQARSDDSTAA